MSDVSTFRLYLLRATYLFIFVGLGFMIWPGIINPSKQTPLANSVVSSLLAGVSLLALLGIRYPLKLLPIIFFELIWKSIWLIAFALPKWSANQLDAGTLATVSDCLGGIVLFPIVIPWRYVLITYVKAAGDRWEKLRASS